MLKLPAVLLGKAIFALTRFLKQGGGSAAPGLYALKVDPDLVKKLAGQIPTNIVITGTNGKTTTSRLVAHFAKQANLKVIRNHTGSNLERGIASTLIQNSKLHLEGVNLNFDLGIWEVDEAAFNIVAPKLKPKIVIFLNVFRDQLDRYGEVDTVLKKWGETLKKLDPNTIILVNGDDANTLKLKKYFKGKFLKFGVKDYKIIGESIEKKKEKENLDFEAKNVKLKGLSGSRFEFTMYNVECTINLTLPGIYHIYDAIAALACATILVPNIPINRFTNSLKTFSPAFGRVEKFSLQPGRLKHKVDGFIFLIKNPAGATQVFETIAPQIKKQDRLLLALNDNLADGTDVSWIWDAEFEVLLQTQSRVKPRELSLYVSGTRSYDLANRLKYAGFDPKNITVEEDLEKAFKASKKGLKGKLFILPTYTAMLQLQQILVQSGLKKPYWEVEA